MELNWWNCCLRVELVSSSHLHIFKLCNILFYILWWNLESKKNFHFNLNSMWNGEETVIWGEFRCLFIGIILSYLEFHVCVFLQIEMMKKKLLFIPKKIHNMLKLFSSFDFFNLYPIFDAEILNSHAHSQYCILYTESWIKWTLKQHNFFFLPFQEIYRSILFMLSFNWRPRNHFEFHFQALFILFFLSLFILFFYIIFYYILYYLEF